MCKHETELALHLGVSVALLVGDLILEAAFALEAAKCLLGPKSLKHNGYQSTEIVQELWE